MARTVDTSSTFENWRQNYNDLASDVGGLGSLTTADKSSVVNAINYIMDQYFYFQDFEFDGSDGATSNTVFSGADNAGNTFAYSPGKLLVFKQGLLLRSGTDYTAVNGTSVTLASSANNGDIIRMSVFTGSYENVGAASSATSNQWILAGSTIYNQNIGGVVINADSTITTTLGVADSIQLQGNTYANGSIYLNAQNDLRFQDSDSSHYAAIQAPATISANYTLTLPADDGTSGQTLQTDGNGVLTWSSATATDVNVVANNSANETVYPVFVDGATGSQGVESDTGLTYNPSSGTLTSTVFVGALTGNSSTATVLASNRNFSIAGDITASAIAFNGSGNVALSATIDDNTVDASALNISGNGSSGQALLSDGDGSFSWGAGGKTTEEIQDIAGAMFTSNTETGIAATYEDGDGTVDLVVSGITSAMITDGTIDTGDIANDAITAALIDDNAVGAAALNVSGNGSSGQILASDGDGTFSWAADSGLSSEQVQDIVGAMFSSNTETRISATYQDGDGTIDLVVDDMTANTTYSVGDGGLTTNDFTNADHSKLNAIEASATADQSNAEIRTAVEAASDSNVFTDADHSKLNGIESGATADQTSVSGNAGTATALATARTIGGTSFDGTANIAVALAATATTLATARAIGGVNFDGSAAITLPGVNSAGNQNTSGTAAGLSGSPTVDLNNLTCDQIGVNVAANGTDGRIDAGNDIVAFSSSDIALKENINPITNALDKVLSLGGYTFDWKKEREKEHGYTGSDIGVLAQEVEDVLPTAVRDNCYGNKSVRYEKLIPLLVQSIKELKTELDELKSSNS